MSKARDLADLGNVTARLDEVGNTDGALSNRNLIINGAMQVAQRGTSFTSDGYTLDRWRIGVYGGQGGAVTVTQQAFTPSSSYPNLFKNYLQYAISSVPSTASQNLHQRIEDVLTANGQQVTLSFWAKVTSGTYSLDTVFNNSGGGSGGGTASQSHSLTTTWTKFTHTVQLPEVTGGTTGSATFLRMDFTFPRTEGAATIQITGVQLEVGDTATPFEHRSYGQELALCQRYFHKFGGDGIKAVSAGATWTSAYAYFPYKLPVTMRATPTLTTGTVGSFYILAVSPSTYGLSGIGLAGANGPDVAEIECLSASMTAGQGCWLRAYADTHLSFDAEL